MRSSVDYELPAEVEKLFLVGTAAWGSGNGLSNQLVGNDADNRLLGWGGDDMLTGAAGDDMFIFLPQEGGFGTDTITDFWPGQGSNDQLAFSSALFSSAEQARAACWTVGADIWVAHSADNIVVLANTDLIHLTVDDFTII